MLDGDHFEPRHSTELAVIAGYDSASMLDRSRRNDQIVCADQSTSLSKGSVDLGMDASRLGCEVENGEQVQQTFNEREPATPALPRIRKVDAEEQLRHCDGADIGIAACRVRREKV